MYAGGVACGAFMGKVPPALPELRGTLGLTLVESGFIATMINFLGALAGMPAGLLADRLGHKRLALSGRTARSRLSSSSLSPGLASVFTPQGASYPCRRADRRLRTRRPLCRSVP